jgi:chemotaxis family two-component system sensor histidine kinase/response regulator PixL
MATIQDDGQGIDHQKLAAKALENNITTADELAEMDDSELLDLIFREGLSTREKVSTVSGRGLGLYAVRQEIAALEGTIRVRSQAGIGTTFEIKLPHVLPSLWKKAS